MDLKGGQIEPPGAALIHGAEWEAPWNDGIEKQE
jgi:hypothetical protein